jgi:hypothetical protein
MITTIANANKLGLSVGRVSVLARQGRFVHAQKKGGRWAITAAPVINSPLKAKHRSQERQN